MAIMAHFSDKEEDVIPLGESSDDGSEDLNMNEISERFDDEIKADSDSDSDSAPETFSFTAAQEKGKQAKRIAVESLKQQKALLKRKRKDILLQNMKQREEKRKKIESKRLPDHVLENLDDDYNEEMPLENESSDPKEQLDKTKDVEQDILETVGNITFKCKILPVEVRKTKYIPEKITHFKDNLLYNRRIRREKSKLDYILKKMSFK